LAAATPYMRIRSLLTVDCSLFTMPARPLFWLTVFFMLGISAYRLFGESLPVQSYYYALAALVLIAVFAATLRSRSPAVEDLSPALSASVFCPPSSVDPPPSADLNLPPSPRPRVRSLSFVSCPPSSVSRLPSSAVLPSPRCCSPSSAPGPQNRPPRSCLTASSPSSTANRPPIWPKSTGPPNISPKGPGPLSGFSGQ